MKAFPLAEGKYTVDDSKIFIPFNPSVDQLDERPASLVVDIIPFLIETKNDLIIIDPGLGLTDEDGEFKIHSSIARHGYSADDVNKVLLSHLHKDHMGGIAYGRNGAFNLMFPSAEYFCQEKEMEFAFTKKNSSSFQFDKLEFLQHSRHLTYLNGNGMLNDEVHFEVSGGHTPYHQVFILGGGKEKYFFGGDVLPQPSQIIRRFIAKYDYDGKLSAQRRIEYAKRGADENWIFLFFHDGTTPMARVNYEHHRFTIQKI